MEDIFSKAVEFEWDDGNKDKNLPKHNVTNYECEEIFFNEPLLIINDEVHSKQERRYAAFGITDGGRKLIVVFTLRKRLIRIISARDMHKKERDFYEKNS